MLKTGSPVFCQHCVAVQAAQQVLVSVIDFTNQLWMQQELQAGVQQAWQQPTASRVKLHTMWHILLMCAVLWQHQLALYFSHPVCAAANGNSGQRTLFGSVQPSSFYPSVNCGPNCMRSYLVFDVLWQHQRTQRSCTQRVP
jgi:hypothetical protein